MLERPIDSFFRGSSGDGKNCSRCIAINKSKREKEKRKKYQGKDIRVWMMFGNDRSLAISRAWRSYRDFLMYLKRKGMFIMIMGTVLDVYPPFVLPYPTFSPVCSPIFLLDGISTHVLVYTTYALYTHIHVHASGRRHDKKKRYDARYICVMYACLFRQKRPIYN